MGVECGESVWRRGETDNGAAITLQLSFTRKWFSVKAVFQQPLVAKCCMAYAGEYDYQECGGTALRDRALGVAKKLLAAVNYQEKVHPEGGDSLNACLCLSFAAGKRRRAAAMCISAALWDLTTSG